MSWLDFGGHLKVKVTIGSSMWWQRCWGVSVEVHLQVLFYVHVDLSLLKLVVI